MHTSVNWKLKKYNDKKEKELKKSKKVKQEKW